MQISVLDQSPITEGSSAGEALRNSVDLARLADECGYSRYWVAEHHASRGLACASPEVLIGPIAAATRDIRVGSGGVMLPHYSPLKVAESFSMLNDMYGGRVDLGVGRAPGSSSAVALALQRDRRQRPPEDFPQQLEELLTLIGYRLPEGGAFPALAAPKVRLSTPEPWLLGSSPDSSVWAAEYGLPYCFADFINPYHPEITRHCRARFRQCGKLEKPRVGVAVWAICAESEAEALRLSLSFRMMILMLYSGRSIPVPSPETAHNYLSQVGPVDSLPAGRRILTGTPEGVASSLDAIAQEYQADEMFVVNIMHDHEARRRSYSLLAEALDLRQSSAATYRQGI